MRAAELLARLNDQQRDAVLEPGDTLVVAGPGSGKTDTITAKVAHLLLNDVARPQRVACLSYSNDAADEFASRLRKLGVDIDGRLFTGTAHSFCLNAIIRPYAALAGMPSFARPTVLTRQGVLLALADVVGDLGLALAPATIQRDVNKVRRDLATGVPESGLDQQLVSVAKAYEQHIRARGEIDFEGMLLTGLEILTGQPAIADLIICRYPWLAVDEYQDLFEPLHRLVLVLRGAGAHVFAVGDPDQCVNEYAGGDPRFLSQLGAAAGVRTVPLRFNYRSGGRIVTAAQAGLAQTRDYVAQAHREGDGEIFFNPVDGDLEAQAQLIAAQLVPAAVAAGTAMEEIAILYRAKGAVPETIEAALTDAGIAVASERDLRFPKSPVAIWLRHAAARAVGASSASTLTELARSYRHLKPLTNRPESWLNDRLLLAQGCEAVDTVTPTAQWVAEFAGITGLRALLDADPARKQDLADLDELTDAGVTGTTVGQFARGTAVVGKVVLTTLHSSKGREFDQVILPALQQGVLPDGVPWENWRARPTTLPGDRRLFYVGLTRARHRIDLVYSHRLTPLRTNMRRYGDMPPSQFIAEVDARLSS